MSGTSGCVGVQGERPPGIEKVMRNKQKIDPLQGITLEKVVSELVEHYGWEELSQRVNINCFKSDPSIKSSLKFLRKTQWARDKVERLYISTIKK